MYTGVCHKIYNIYGVNRRRKEDIFMATIRKRGKNSYQIRVSCGYSTAGAHMEQTMTWTAAEGMTERQIQKELNRQAVMFEEACMKGQLSTAVKFQDYCDQWFRDYAELKLKARTIYTYRLCEKRVQKALGEGFTQYRRGFGKQGFTFAERDEKFFGKRDLLFADFELLVLR